jgi:hypothetical protein
MLGGTRARNERRLDRWDCPEGPPSPPTFSPSGRREQDVSERKESFMIQRIGNACAVLVLFGAIRPGALCLAKPPDLPGDIRQQCPLGREGQQAEGFAARPQDLEPQVVNPSTPRLPVQRTREENLTSPLRMSAPRPRQESARPALSIRELEARHLFDIAELCVSLGDLAKARTCYEEAHVICPTSACGRLAIDRLRELDRARFGAGGDTAEEQEAPPVRSSYRETTEDSRRGASQPRMRDANQPSEEDVRRQEMLRETEPLGTAPLRPSS